MSMRIERLIADCAARGISAQVNVPLAPRTTYGVGGNAAVVVTVSPSDVSKFASVLTSFPDLPIVILGRGSNVLVSDDGFQGVVVLLASDPNSDAIDVNESTVTVAATVPMPVLARRTAAAGRTGLEWCVGIPGSVGAAVRMNAGGHGADMRDSLISATVVSLRSGNTEEVLAQDMGLHFRGSALATHHVVLSVTLRTETAEGGVASAAVDAIVAWRRDNQPGGRNAGSVFVNPAPDSGSAGALIDAAGLRGYCVGNAQVSEKHANFIQAKNGATSQDIIDVMSHVQACVDEVHGVRMRSEVVLVGFNNDVTSRFADPRHTEPARVEASQRLAIVMGDAL